MTGVPLLNNRIKIQNGHIIDPKNGIDEVGDLYIEAGKIVAPQPEKFKDAVKIDASKQIVCPGLIDLRAALREPGLEHKGNVQSETSAAAKGGITRVVIEPDTTPVIDTPAVVELIQQRNHQAGLCHVSVLGALTQDLAAQQISEMGALAKSGCVGVSQARENLNDLNLWRKAVAYASTFNLPVFTHALDSALTDQGVMHQSAISTRLGLRGIPDCAETVAVASQLLIFEETQSRGHFCNLTSNKATRMVGRARFDGVPVSSDVAIHHLFLTHEHLIDFDGRYLVQPPLRSAEDRQGLIRGLKENIIQAICSDHLPHEADAKLAPLDQVEAGISGLETLLSLVVKLAKVGDFKLNDLLAKVTSEPAEILSLNSGHLAIGAPADVCIFDLNATWKVKGEEFVSQGKHTPFDGWELPAPVTHTFLDGRLVYQK
ncbi:MAG TPA: dihydroorotase [Gammaproteobacteria bacterium]|nr:dihydroorotase [Gammaproteobacteria bacterium]